MFPYLSSYRMCLLSLLFTIGLASSIITGRMSRLSAEAEKPGYTDTPLLPDGKWRVHDRNRPYPPVISSGTASTQTVTGRPPSDAIVLFDGTNLSQWTAEKDGKKGKPGWKVENGYMEIVPDSGNLVSLEAFGDCQIHLEWASPTQPHDSGQDRGNSGVLIMGKYEIQILDSYQSVTYADGQAGAMYGQYPPLVNASRRPGEWQTYDIVFEAPRFVGAKVQKPAYVTVLHNGIVLHHRQPFIGAAAWRQLARYQPHEPTGPLQLQDHDHPVRYRNIWIRPLGQYP